MAGHPIWSSSVAKPGKTLDCGHPLSPPRHNQVIYHHLRTQLRASRVMLDMTYNVSITMEATLRPLILLAMPFLATWVARLDIL
jgi:hypothetical protein